MTSQLHDLITLCDISVTWHHVRSHNLWRHVTPELDAKSSVMWHHGVMWCHKSHDVIVSCDVRVSCDTFNCVLIKHHDLFLELFSALYCTISTEIYGTPHYICSLTEKLGWVDDANCWKMQRAKGCATLWCVPFCLCLVPLRCTSFNDVYLLVRNIHCHCNNECRVNIQRCHNQCLDTAVLHVLFVQSLA